MITFTKKELRDLTISFIVIAVAFAISHVKFDIHGFISILPIVMVGVGFGFLYREIGHKYVAMKYGYDAEFKMWPLGLVISLATALIGWVFAAPGAAKINAENIPPDITGRISVAGPMANMSLALIFIIIASLVYPLTSYSRIFDLTYMISTIGFSVNSYLAAFNLFPLYTLDGLNVVKWNKKVWAAAFVISMTMMILSTFIGAENMVTFMVGLVR